MLKNAYDASPLSVSREALLNSAARFLQRLSGDSLLVPLADMTSAEQGAPDLAFVRRGTSDIVTAMVHRRGDFAGFALRAAAYHCWLKECVTLGEAILSRAIGLAMYVVSPDVPSAESYLLKVFSHISGLRFIEYRILSIEAQQAPAIRFHLLDSNPPGQDASGGKKGNEETIMAGSGGVRLPPEYALSSQEIDEFNLLKERHL